MKSTPATPWIITRRKSLLVGSSLAWSLPMAWATARAQGRLRPTPTQTEGPYYPTQVPADADNDLLVNGSRTFTPQLRALVEGVVTDTAGKPLQGATVEIWQCDQQGHYHHPSDGNRADPAFQGFGRATVDADGRYSFRTMRPAPYSGRTPHIHVKVKRGNQDLLTTQMYVEGDPGNARDGLWRRLRDADDRAALTVPFVPRGDGWVNAKFPIVVEA